MSATKNGPGILSWLMCYFTRLHDYTITRLHDQVNAEQSVCKLSLVSVFCNFHCWSSALDGVLLFSQQQEKSNQKSAVRDVFYSCLLNNFLTHRLGQHVHVQSRA